MFHEINLNSITKSDGKNVTNALEKDNSIDLNLQAFLGEKMYAIVNIAGKQYKVAEGDKLKGRSPINLKSVKK